MDKESRLYLAILIFQVVCAILFLLGLISTVTGLFQINWQFYEAIELAAALGLLVGAGLGGNMLRRSLKEKGRMQQQLKAASGAFMDHLSDQFDEWMLTPAERDVALFAIKGMSTAEIATLRGVSEGTIKAQTNAIYRKADVSGRSQLLSFFIDGLVELPMDTPRAEKA